MKNLVQNGDVLDLVAPYALATAGLGFKVGSIFAVAQSDAANGAAVCGAVAGVYNLVKTASQAWTVGAKIYWDDTTKACTTTAASNLLIGVAVVAVGSGAGETIGCVRLSGAFTI